MKPQMSKDTKENEIIKKTELNVEEPEEEALCNWEVPSELSKRKHETTREKR